MTDRALTIVSVGSSFVPISRDAPGGSEQITYRLDKALVEAGHRSIVLGCRGSRIAGQLAPVEPIAEERGRIPPQTWQRHRDALAAVLAANPVDLVHIHSVDFFQLLPPPGVRTLVTLHMPPFWYPPAALRQTGPEVFMHCVSRTQHRAFAPDLGLLDPIENGVPVNELAGAHARRSFALSIGRICPEKGVHLALDAARRAAVPLVVAGDVFPFEAHLRYMREEVAPRLDRARRFIGPLGFQRKRRFLNAARCVLIPVLEPETSCLVAMEALACGTPVIAFPRGALREIVRHEETGFLVDSVEAMAEAVTRVDSIDPEACRRFARARLSLERMSSRYIDRYRWLAAMPVAGALAPEPGR